MFLTRRMEPRIEIPGPEIGPNSECSWSYSMSAFMSSVGRSTSRLLQKRCYSTRRNCDGAMRGGDGERINAPLAVE